MNNKNKPSFPITDKESDLIRNGFDMYTGLTKREYFAAMALQGLSGQTGAQEGYIIDRAISLSDGLLEALEAPVKKENIENKES